MCSVCVVLLFGWWVVVGSLCFDNVVIMSPVQLPHLDSLRFVLCRGNTTKWYGPCGFERPSFSWPARVRDGIVAGA